MLAELLQYLDEYPEKEGLFAEAFIEEIKTSPHVRSLVTLIKMLSLHTYVFDKKRFFTDELVTEMANQLQTKSARIKTFSEYGGCVPISGDILQYTDGLVYKAYGIHSVKPKSKFSRHIIIHLCNEV